MKKELLKFFIPHFIEMARKSNHFNATRQAKFYLRHAERLQTLLRECDYGRPEEDYYAAEFETLYQEMDIESAHRVFAPTKPKLPTLTVPPTKPIQPALTVPPTKPIQPALTVPPTKPIQPALRAPPTNEKQPTLTAPPTKPIQPALRVPPTNEKQPALTETLTNETQTALTVTPKKTERSVQFTQSVLSKDDLNRKVEALKNRPRSRKNILSPSSFTETYDEQSQPNTYVVTNAEVHNTNTNTNSPESRTDVTDY
jgi:hypothetical protein